MRRSRDSTMGRGGFENNGYDTLDSDKGSSQAQFATGNDKDTLNPW